MSKNYMVIILKEPNKKPQIIKIPKTIKAMSKLICGSVEEKLYEDVIVVYNENQKDIKLENNLVFEDLNIKGTILIVGNNQISGDIESLRKKQILKYISKMKYNEKNKEEER